MNTNFKITNLLFGFKLVYWFMIFAYFLAIFYFLKDVFYADYFSLLDKFEHILFFFPLSPLVFILAILTFFYFSKWFLLALLCIISVSTWYYNSVNFIR